MPSRIIIALLLTTLGLSCYGQEEQERIGSTKRTTIQSSYLEEERSIEIYLPPSYTTMESKSYPVVYVMDGQEYFFHPVAYQRMLRFKDKSPECIVIGIDSDRKRRRKLYYEDADLFINFLKEELIPLIDDDYRTLRERERIYFGWEMAAGLGLEVCAQHPTLFSAFFLASPTHLTGERIFALNESLAEGSLNNTYVYLTKAPEESFLEEVMHQLDSVFTTHSSNTRSWKIDELPGEDHYTTSLKTVNNGLRDYFLDYNTLRFSSLKAYDEFGDLDAIQSYYQHRGNRYGISPEVHRTTQHFLLYHSMNEHKIERFENYAKVFAQYFQDPALDVWPVRFGNFLAKHGKNERAWNIYDLGLQKYPDSAAIHHAIGGFYNGKGDKENAAIYYRRAVELASKNGDLKLEEYQTDLERL